MAIDNYLGNRTDNNRDYSRRDMLRLGLAGLGALALGSMPYQSRADDKRTLSDADRHLLVDNSDWTDDKNLKQEYNSLAVKFVETLDEKGKYDPKKREALRKSCFQMFKKIDPKERVAVMKRELLIETSPDEYFKNAVLSDNERTDIRLTAYDSRTKPYVDEYSLTLNVDPEHLDLSDKIRINRSLRKPSELEKRALKEPVSGAVKTGSNLFKFLQK